MARRISDVERIAGWFRNASDDEARIMFQVVSAEIKSRAPKAPKVERKPRAKKQDGDLAESLERSVQEVRTRKANEVANAG